MNFNLNYNYEFGITIRNTAHTNTYNCLNGGREGLAPYLLPPTVASPGVEPSIWRVKTRMISSTISDSMTRPPTPLRMCRHASGRPHRSL